MISLKKLSGDERFIELARFLRNLFEARGWTVEMGAAVLWPITGTRLYDVLGGRRSLDGWEVALFHKRTGVLIPAKHLMGLDAFERRVKHRDPNQIKMEGLLKESERAWKYF